MNFFDLHCDTVTTAYEQKKSLLSGEMHINSEKGRYIDAYKQCFALWIDDKFKGKAAFSFCESMIFFYENEVAGIKKNGITNLTPVLTVENASALMGDIDNISYFKSRGVRMITLTWNGENELGCGADSNDSHGLKPFGKRAVQKMEKEGVIVDVSHLNEQGFRDVACVASEPFVASHSGCFSLVPHKRNLKDWQIKEIISAGGLIGIPLCKNFIGGGKEKVYEQLCHILSSGGENNVAFGSDFDGCDIHSELSGIEKMGELYSFLCESDIGREITDKVFYLNAEKFFHGKY
ncbi:MAG: membrane dipeptidase [Clostridia bacterium]|nr:membrane dipeptidase [Clostridia bacterium]